MGAAQVGYIVGGFFASILVPVIILIICNFIPAAKRNPKVVYGICGILAVAVAFVSATGGGDIVSAGIVAVLAALFFFWGYTRAAKKVAAA
jgi:hypothetical protein